jgi:hypothetical protein
MMMIVDVRRLVFTCIVIVMAAFQSSAQGQSCTTLPEDSPDPVITVCATDTDYHFTIGDRSRSFDRQVLESKLASATTRWLSAHGLTTEWLLAKPAQLWLTVPEANPEAAQPRFIVSTSAGSIGFWFDLWAEEWVFSDRETALFDTVNYPQSYGYRPQTILIQAHPGKNPEQVREALMACGAKAVVDQGNGWFHASGAVFGERALAADVKTRQSSVVKIAQVNAVMEWIAHRKMVFTFDMNMNDGDPPQ